MRKRVLSLLLAILTVAGMFPSPAFAADTIEEAMAEINVYARNDDLAWLTMNGSVKEQHYTYYSNFAPCGIATKFSKTRRKT